MAAPTKQANEILGSNFKRQHYARKAVGYSRHFVCPLVLSIEEIPPRRTIGFASYIRISNTYRVTIVRVRSSNPKHTKLPNQIQNIPNKKTEGQSTGKRKGSQFPLDVLRTCCRITVHIHANRGQDKVRGRRASRTVDIRAKRGRLFIGSSISEPGSWAADETPASCQRSGVFSDGKSL